MPKPILIIHPRDNTTRFLNRVKNHLVYDYHEIVHHFNIQYSDSSHNECLERIVKHQESGLILFFGHGRSDSLYGSKAPLYDQLVSEDAVLEQPEKYYGKEVFINEENAEAFKGKKVFCLACNSNSKLAQKIIDAGAITFLGFGDIPSSIKELKEQGESDNLVSLERMVRELKTEYNYIIKKSLGLAILNSFTFEQLYDMIRFISNQRISDILVNKSHLKERRRIADYLYNFKSEMKIYGDKAAPLI